MIPNTNDGTNLPPRLRIDIHNDNVFTLPPYSSGPKGDDHAVLAAVKAAGFEGIQTNTKVAVARQVGLRVTASNRVDTPADGERCAIETMHANADCCTVHIGTGLEDDDQVYRLVEGVLRASEKHAVPIYIETHRATVTQDIWRTVQLVKKFPEIRFNGDFSHYYTGHEMIYGNVEAKWQFMQPIFDRVRFMHGRIGNSGSMQVDIGDGASRPHVEHFKEMWTRGFVGFLKSAKPGDYLCFTPELLHPPINYARLFRNAAGELVEECDRWKQALLYTDIARQCWAVAQKRAATNG